MIELPHNTNLERIRIIVFNEKTLKSFITGLELNVKPCLRELKLILPENECLEHWVDTWPLLDNALSTIFTVDEIDEGPELVVELPSGGLEVVMEQMGACEYEGYLEDLTGEVKILLPQTALCWNIDVVFGEQKR